MAAEKVGTRGAKPSNVIVYEAGKEYGHCRSVNTVTVEAGMDIGAVVVLSAGKYVWVEAADIATLAADVRIVVDQDTAITAAGDASLVTLSMAAGGYAGVARGGLLFKDALTSGQVDTVVAKLNAKGIKVLTQA